MKKLLSIVLCFLMITMLLPVAFAEEIGDTDATQQEIDDKELSYELEKTSLNEIGIYASVSSSFLSDCSASYKSGQYYKKLAALVLSGNQASDVVKVANSQIGYHESNSSSDFSGESNGSDNYTEYNRWYFQNTSNHQAWCNLFVSWCRAAAGISTSVSPKNPFYLSKWRECGAKVYSWKDYAAGSVTPKPGDIIIFGSSTTNNTTGNSLSDSYKHIGIITGYSNGTFNTVEGNTSDQVKAKTYTPNSSTGYISSSYYVHAIVQPTYNQCSHDSYYTSEGQCRKCGAWLPNQDDNYSYTAGTYAVKSGKTAYLREGHPYQIATPYITLSAGQTVWVYGCVLNGFGNKWYRCSYNSKEYWCVAGNLELKAAASSDLKITMPATNHTNRTGIPAGDLVQGQTWNLSGSITSTYYNITNVACHIYNSSGNDAITAYTATPNAKTYDIRTGGMDSKMTFGKLGIGTYTFVVTAKDSSGKTAELRSSFNIVSSAPTTVTVTFNANGGTASYTSKTVTVGSTYGDLPTATRTGYDFNGWYTAASGGSQVTSSTTVTNTSNHTLYAHWTANTYTVTFDANGGTASYTSKTVTYGSTYGDLPTATRMGYHFDGWYTAASGGSQVTSSTTVTNTSNHTLYAHWQANALTINYNANGGVVNSSKYNTASDGTIQENGSNINEVWHYNSADPYGLYNASTFGLSRSGYAFVGWSRSRDGSTTIFGEDDLTLKAQDICTDLAYDDASVVLYAVWSPCTLTVYFNANGGSVSPTSKTVTYGSPYGELPTPTRSGYVFRGWCKNDGTYVTEETIVTDFSDHTLTAVYGIMKPIQIYVQCILDGEWSNDTLGFGTYDYYLNGERVLDDGTYYNQIIYADKEGTYEIKDICVEDGKSFNGIITGETISGKPLSGRTGTLEDNRLVYLDFTTVHPEEWLKDKTYEEHTYNGHTYLYFHDNATWYEAKTICEHLGGHLATITSEEENTFVCSIIPDEGMPWLGGTDKGTEGTWRWITGEPFDYSRWQSANPDNASDNDEGEEDYLHFTIADSVLEGTYYIKYWNDNCGFLRFPFVCEIESITVNVTFDPNGGNTSQTKKTVTYGCTYGELPTPTRSGYSFIGWFTAASGGSQITPSTTVTTASDHTLYAHWSALPAFDGTIEWNSADVSYKGTTPYVIANGSAQTPRFTVKDASGNTVSTNNYTYVYRENTNAGTGYVIVTFTAQYSGTARGWFKIYLPPTTNTTVENIEDGILICWDPVEGAAGYVIYRRAWSSTTNGWTTFERWNNVTGTSWIDGSDDNHKVYAGTRYQYGVKAYFAQRVDPVSGATIGGNVGDNYNLGEVGPLKTTVRITTRKLNSVTAGTNQLTAKWTGSSVFTGYDVQVAANSTFTSNVKTVRITNPKTYQTTIKDLKSNTTYYVRVRSYHVFEGMTYYGEWSNVLNCTIK